MVRSEGNMSLKNQVAPPGIDPGTVRLVAQRLNQYATPGPTPYVNIKYYTCILVEESELNHLLELTGVSRDISACCLDSSRTRNLGLVDPKEAGTTIIRNVENHATVAASCLRRHESLQIQSCVA